LAREPGCDEVDLREAANRADIADDVDFWESCSQDVLRPFFDLAEELCVMAGSVET
jgi:hypothetical protein